MEWLKMRFIFYFFFIFEYEIINWKFIGEKTNRNQTINEENDELCWANRQFRFVSFTLDFYGVYSVCIVCRVLFT